MLGFVLRGLRLFWAAVVAILIAVCVAHQGLQVVALSLPSTAGFSSGAAQTWASFGLGDVHGWGFAVPSSRFDLVSERYRFKAGGQWYEALRIQLDGPIPMDSYRPGSVDVHYAPWAPRFAVAAPVLSPVLWLFLLCVWMPVLYVLLWPGRAARWFLGTVQALSPLPRRGGGGRTLQEELASEAAEERPRRRWRSPRRRR